MSRDAKLLLLWIVARCKGLVFPCSASHADVLFFIADIGKAHAELRRKMLVAADSTSYEATAEGKRYLREGFS